MYHNVDKHVTCTCNFFMRNTFLWVVHVRIYKLSLVQSHTFSIKICHNRSINVSNLLKFGQNNAHSIHLTHLKKYDKKAISDLQNTTQKTKHLPTWTPQKMAGWTQTPQKDMCFFCFLFCFFFLQYNYTFKLVSGIRPLIK